MAFTCDDCKYIFTTKRTSCPFCGGRVYDNTHSEQYSLNTGYSLAPSKPTKDGNQSSTARQDPYDDLRQSFFNSQSPDTLEDNIPEASPVKINNIPTAEDSNAPSGIDYFSQFSNKPHSGDDIPTVEPTIQTHDSVPQQNNDPYEQELQALERQRQHLERQYRRRSIFNFIANIRWRTIFRVLFILLLVIVAVTIWKMRYVIFNSIISFLISLLPIILIIGILWYIFRSFFR